MNSIGFYFGAVFIVVGVFSLLIGTEKIRLPNQDTSKAKKKFYFVSGIVLILLAGFRVFLTILLNTT